MHIRNNVYTLAILLSIIILGYIFSRVIFLSETEPSAPPPPKKTEEAKSQLQDLEPELAITQREIPRQLDSMSESNVLAKVSHQGDMGETSKLLGLPEENVKLIEFDFDHLDKVTEGDVVRIILSDDNYEDFYMTQVLETDDNRSLIGHLSQESPAYYFGLVYDDFGAITGTVTTLDSNFSIQTITGKTVLHKSIQKEVQHD